MILILGLSVFLRIRFYFQIRNKYYVRLRLRHLCFGVWLTKITSYSFTLNIWNAISGNLSIVSILIILLSSIMNVNQLVLRRLSFSLVSALHQYSSKTWSYSSLKQGTLRHLQEVKPEGPNEMYLFLITNAEKKAWIVSFSHYKSRKESMNNCEKHLHELLTPFI